MAITDENNGTGMVMPVQPLGGYGGGNNGGFGWGSDWIILFLFAMMFGGWGGGFGGGFGGYGNMMLGYDFPWLLNGQNGINTNVNDGFRTAQLSDSVTSVRDGIAGLATQMCGGFGDTQMSLANGFANVNTNVSNGFAGVNLGIANGTANIQNSLCNGFNGVQQAVSGAQNALAQQMYTNQISDLERSFAAQTANTQGLTNLSAQLANCCCENRSATNDVKYTIATEACNTRAANTANTQAILDKLCQLELDNYKTQVEAKNDTIAQLRSQLQFANMQASQVDQTAQIRANNATVANQLVSELRSCPIPAQPVYGNQPIFTCPQTVNSCGCGCGA